MCIYHSQHGIPVFCPSLTDGSIGDMLYFHSYQKGDQDRNPGLVLDIVGGIISLSYRSIK